MLMSYPFFQYVLIGCFVVFLVVTAAFAAYLLTIRLRRRTRPDLDENQTYLYAVINFYCATVGVVAFIMAVMFITAS